MSSQPTSFDLPTQFSIDKVKIKDIDVTGLFIGLEYFESIFTPASGGTLLIYDTDGAGLRTRYELEFIEEIEFEFTNARDEKLEFKGVMNGIRNESVFQQKKMFCIDFTTEQVRKNEGNFVYKAFRNLTPEEISKEMVEKIGGKIDDSGWVGKGQKMTFLGARKRPNEVIRTCLTGGIAEDLQKPSATSYNPSQAQPQKGETKGSTGFYCWQTLDGYRFASVNDLLSGNVGKEHEEYVLRLQNQSLSMDETMQSIIEYDFPQLGDFQTHQRAGAFKNKLISFNISTGQYQELVTGDNPNATEKQKEQNGEEPTRVMSKPYIPERYQNSCEKAAPDYWDQSRKTLAQGAQRLNTFNDQIGKFTLAPQFTMRAGDCINVKINKIESEKEGGVDEKHSGKYTVAKVGHHFGVDGKSYTRVTTIRSTIQQDDASSNKV